MNYIIYYRGQQYNRWHWSSFIVLDVACWSVTSSTLVTLQLELVGTALFGVVVKILVRFQHCMDMDWLAMDTAYAMSGLVKKNKWKYDIWNKIQRKCCCCLLLVTIWQSSILNHLNMSMMYFLWLNVIDPSFSCVTWQIYPQKSLQIDW
jgi:hypothetical protein